MITPEKRIPSVSVEGFNHQHIQNQSATTNSNPFKEGHLEPFCVVAVNEGQSITNLVEITPSHGRSFSFEKGVIWEDENGNLFSALNIKGNNCRKQGIFISGSAPSGLLPYGVQEGDALVRILKASKLLRSLNVDTEAIVRVIEPTELVFEGEKVPVQEFKNRLIRKLWDEDAKEREVDEKTGLQKIPRSDLPQVSDALNEMIFFFTVRGLQTSERIHDLYTAEGDKFIEILGKALDFVNLDEERKHKKDSSYEPEHFLIDNREDVSRYLTDYLPKRLATNFEKMHKAGLVQGLANYGNVSTVGSIYDLDTVKGEPLGLGDKKITYEDIMNDISELTDGIFNTSAGEIESMDSDFRRKFLLAFMNKYFAELKIGKEMPEYEDFKLDLKQYLYLLLIEGPAIIEAYFEMEKRMHIYNEDADKLLNSDGERLAEIFEKALTKQITDSLTSFRIVRSLNEDATHLNMIKELFAHAFAKQKIDDMKQSLKPIDLVSKFKLAKELSKIDIYEGMDEKSLKSNDYPRNVVLNKFLFKEFIGLVLKEIGERAEEHLPYTLGMDESNNDFLHWYDPEEFFQKTYFCGELYREIKAKHVREWVEGIEKEEKEAQVVGV